MPNVLKNDCCFLTSTGVVVIHRKKLGAAAITLLEPEDIAFWYGGKGGLFIADAVGPVSRVRKTVSVLDTNHVMFTIALTRKVTHHRTEYCFNSGTYLLRTHTGP